MPKKKKPSNQKEDPKESKSTSKQRHNYKRVLKHKPDPPSQPLARKKKYRQLIIQKIMQDPEKMAMIQEMAETGASLSTMDAKLQLKPGTMNRLLTKGKAKTQKIYYQFYLKFRSWASEATWAAESNMAKKTPDKWLERSSTARTVQTEEEVRDISIQQKQAGTIPGVEAAMVLQSLKILANQGISIDEALKNNEVDTILPTLEHKPKEETND